MAVRDEGEVWDVTAPHCACPRIDAAACVRVRYPDGSAWGVWLDSDRCECVCHDADEDEDDDHNYDANDGTEGSG